MWQREKERNLGETRSGNQRCKLRMKRPTKPVLLASRPCCRARGSALSRRMETHARRKKAPGVHHNRMRARLEQARRAQSRLSQQQVARWLHQFDVNRSGRLERHELSALLQSLHPEAGVPNSKALDFLITQATELRTHTLTLRGDPNGAVGCEGLLRVVSGCEWRKTERETVRPSPLFSCSDGAHFATVFCRRHVFAGIQCIRRACTRRRSLTGSTTVSDEGSQRRCGV